MCQHRPQTSDLLCRQPQPELREIAFEIGCDELGAPVEALLLGVREVAARKATAQPEAVDVGAGYDLGRFAPGMSIDVTVQNLLDNEHREFIGAPLLGRLALARLNYTF